MRSEKVSLWYDWAMSLGACRIHPVDFEGKIRERLEVFSIVCSSLPEHGCPCWKSDFTHYAKCAAWVTLSEHNCLDQHDPSLIGNQPHSNTATQQRSITHIAGQESNVQRFKYFTQVPLPGIETGAHNLLGRWSYPLGQMRCLGDTEKTKLLNQKSSINPSFFAIFAWKADEDSFWIVLALVTVISVWHVSLVRAKYQFANISELVYTNMFEYRSFWVSRNLFTKSKSLYWVQYKWCNWAKQQTILITSKFCGPPEQKTHF